MMKCWAKSPNDRPFFSDIVVTISNYTENIAGYLDVSFNPFMYARISTTGKVDQDSGSNISDTPAIMEYDIMTSTEQLAKHKGSKKTKSRKNHDKQLKGSPSVSPRTSPSRSPKVSPCASPQTSKLLLSLEDDQLSIMSGAAPMIEIRVESPSDEGSVVITGSFSSLH